MAKLTLPPVPSGYLSTQALNARFEQIEEAIEDTVSRSGKLPNAMEADFDFGKHSLLNIDSFEAQRITLGGTVTDLTDVQNIAGIGQAIVDLASIEFGPVAENTLTDLGSVSTELFEIIDSLDTIDLVGDNIVDVNTVATNISNVNTVAGIDANVTLVGNSAADVNAVAGDLADVATVAGQISPVNNVSTVAGISSDISTTAGISADITAVALNNSNVNTVAANIGNVNTTASNINNVWTVATNITYVNLTASYINDVRTVATNIGNVNTVAGINAAISNVSGISADVTAVNTNSANVNTVATNIADVNTVGSVSADVTTVAGISADVTAVADNNADVTTVATNILDVNTVADTIGSGVFVQRTGAAGSAEIPTGTEAQRDGTPAAGYFRFNTDTEQFEGYNGTAWGSVGSGATGAAGDQVFVENDSTVNNSYEITASRNAMSAGPITVDTGVVVTIPSNSRWVIV